MLKIKFNQRSKRFLTENYMTLMQKAGRESLNNNKMRNDCVGCGILYP